MCGLFGYITGIGKNAQHEKEKFTKLSFLSATRGIHSTGYARVDIDFSTKSPKANLLKSAMDPISFLKTREATHFLSSDSIALLGHTRFATKGSVTTKNAHPFRSKDGRFILFHNGTLTCPHDGYETDSEWICNKVAENSGDLEKTLKEVYGAYALVIVDTSEGLVKLVRNTQRPLFYGYQKAGGNFSYASEKWMLDAISSENITEVPVATVLTLDLKKGGSERLSEEKISLSTFSYNNQGYSYGYGGWSRNFWDSEDDLPWTKQNTKSESDKQDGIKKSVENNDKTRSSVPSVIRKTGIQRKTNWKKGDEVLEKKSVFSIDNEEFTRKHLRTLNIPEQDIELLFQIKEKFRVERDVNGLNNPEYFVEIEVYDDNFLTPNEFRRVLKNCCALCNNASLEHEKRHWISSADFLCDDCATQNPNFLH